MQHRGREFLTVVSGHVFVFTLLGPEADMPHLREPRRVRPLHGHGRGRRRRELSAAAAATSPDEPAGGEVAVVRVGEQRVTVRIPAGWEHVDYGKRQEFRRGEARVALLRRRPGPARTRAGKIDDPNARRTRAAHASTTIRAGGRSRPGRPSRSSGRDALAVDTWEPLSHAYRERFYFVLNAGRLLVAAARVMGPAEETKAPLDALVRSIRFAN